MSLLQSCNGQNMDEVIDRLDNESFSDLKGLSVYFRSRGNEKNTNIYFVNSFAGKCSPYVVEVDKSEIEELEIRNNLVLKSCRKDYLEKETIKKAIKKYLELDVSLIQVDSSGNVYINPYEQEPPILLRKSGSSPTTNLNQFELYKGNWYIRK